MVTTFTTRRRFLAALAGAGSAALGGSPWRRAAASAAADSAAQFTNRLRLPGSSGLYAVVLAKDLGQLMVGEMQFEVLPKVPSPFWAYAAEVAGSRVLNPTLLARPGDRVRLRMVNRLKQPTIIHWHGLTNDERNDGIGQYQVGPGRSFDYDFTVRDRAASYWYHPHPHDVAGEQAYRGLAGLLIVRDDDEARLARALDLAVGDTDIPLVIQDRSFSFEGKLEYKLTRDQMFMGFLGEEILVNLTPRPYLDAARRVYRFRILNGSNARSYDPHAAHAAGGLADGSEIPLLQINIRSSPDYKREIPSQLSRLPRLAPAAGEPRRFTLGHDGKSNWTINGWRFSTAHGTPVTVQRGARETWLLQNNRASMPHPMHIHGFQFRVLERRNSPDQIRAVATRSNGLMPQDFGMLDTVLVWPGESVRIALDFSHPFSGDQTYMFHCHNLEHEDTGMMIGYKVRA